MERKFKHGDKVSLVTSGQVAVGTFDYYDKDGDAIVNWDAFSSTGYGIFPPNKRQKPEYLEPQPSEQKPTDLCQGCMGTGVDMHGQRCLNCKGTGAEDVSKALQQHQNYKGGLKILERHLGELYYQSGNLHGQIFEAMQEFAQQSRQQARSEAIQQCIELVIERIRNAGRAEQNGGAEYYPFDSMSLENIVGMRRAYAELKLELEKLKKINP